MGTSFKRALLFAPMALLFSVAMFVVISHVMGDATSDSTVPMTDVGDVELNLTSNSTADLSHTEITEIPQSVTITAPTEHEGERFLYWVDVDRNDKMLTQNNEYTFVFARDRNFKAIYGPAEAYQITFRDFNFDTLLTVSSEDYNETLIPAPEDLLIYPGYRFTGWNGIENIGTASDDILITPVYEKIWTNTYDVEVIGVDTTSVEFDTRTTVTAPEAPEGESFSHWEVNGQTVSYQEDYTFAVMNDITLEPIYHATPEAPQPLITLRDRVYQNTFQNNPQLLFTSQYELLEGQSLVETGVIIYEGELTGDLLLDTEGATVIPSTIQTPSNEFASGLKSATLNEDYHIRAYLVYEDEGTETYIYGDIKEYDTHLEVEYLSFDDVSKGSYAEDTITVNEKDWILNDALIGSLANDKYFGDRALRYQNEGYIQSDFYVEKGVESINFLAARYGSDAAFDLTVSYAYSWSDLTEESSWIEVESFTVDNTILEAKNVVFNIYDPIYIRIQKSGGNRANLDELVINDGNYVDEINPIIEGASSTSISEGDSFDPLDGVTAIDNIDGVLTEDITFEVKDSEDNVIPEPVNFSGLTAGEYTITYAVEDSSNNIGTRTISLTISDIVYDNIEKFSDNNISGGSYTNHTFTGDTGVEWNVTHARSDSTKDGIFMFDSGKGELFGTTSSGVGALKVEVQYGFSAGNASDRSVELFIDNVSYGEYTLQGEELEEFIVDGINVSGTVEIRIENTGSRQIIIGELHWTNFSD